MSSPLNPPMSLCATVGHSVVRTLPVNLPGQRTSLCVL